jgi:kynurenine formamidase
MTATPPRVRVVDLSHEIVDGMTTHPGIPGPVISTFLTHEASAERYAPGTTFEIGRIDMVANTGTYLDTPAHRFRGRPDLSGLELDRVADLDGVLVDWRGRNEKAIGRPKPSRTSRRPGARCWSPPAGTQTGERPPTLRTIPF